MSISGFGKEEIRYQVLMTIWEKDLIFQVLVPNNDKLWGFSNAIAWSLVCCRAENTKSQVGRR